MLEFITSPLNTFFNWGLTKLNINIEHKRQQTVKLKRLLYNLLALKTWVEKEVHMDQQLNRLLTIYADEVGQKMPEGAIYVRSKQAWMLQYIKKKFLSTDKFTAISENIEITLKELSEIDPIFAFELSGIYNITEKLDMVKGYLDGLSAEINIDVEMQDGDIVFDEMLRPQIINEVFVQLQEHVLVVAKMIDIKTYEKVAGMRQQVITPIDEADFKRFMAPLITKIHQKVLAKE
jgi:hypothetical protein